MDVNPGRLTQEMNLNNSLLNSGAGEDFLEFLGKTEERIFQH